jgi:hypothetical protein
MAGLSSIPPRNLFKQIAIFLINNIILKGKINTRVRTHPHIQTHTRNTVSKKYFLYVQHCKKYSKHFKIKDEAGCSGLRL